MTPLTSSVISSVSRDISRIFYTPCRLGYLICLDISKVLPRNLENRSYSDLCVGVILPPWPYWVVKIFRPGRVNHALTQQRQRQQQPYVVIFCYVSCSIGYYINYIVLFQPERTGAAFRQLFRHKAPHYFTKFCFFLSGEFVSVPLLTSFICVIHSIPRPTPAHNYL